jgi:hypothetical protein
MTKKTDLNPKLGYAPSIEDPDPPDYMTDEEIEQMAKRA